VDADMRSPQVACALGIELEDNVTQGLSGDLRTALRGLPQKPNFKLLSMAGKISLADPVQTLSSAAMQKLVESLRHQFNTVVIDSPPVLPFADARVLSRLCDGVVLVCRAGITTHESFHRTREMLDTSRGAHIMDVVLNGVSIGPIDYGRYMRYRNQNSGRRAAGE
jgi:Mrp family chromosome partitioning ATPase